MSDTINISNPYSQYGSLSDDYNGKELRLGLPVFPWKNVTKSIYGRLLGKYDTIINSLKDKNVFEIYIKYYETEKINIMHEAIRAGLKAKLKPGDDLANTLLSTGNSPIIYISNNEFLGDNDNNGQNNYGKNLEQIRHQLKIEQDESRVRVKNDKKQEAIYDTYLAYKTLENIILNGKDISEYTNKSSKEIVDLIGRDKIEQKYPSKRVIIEFSEKGAITEIVRLSYNQNNIVFELNKKNLQKLFHTKIKERNAIVFDMYADYLLEKFYKRFTNRRL